MTGQLKKAGWLSVEQIGEAVDEVLALAKKQGVNVALAGGAAMQIYGSDRFTKDVDFVADGVLDGMDLERSLTFGGAQLLTTKKTPVDLIVRDDDYTELYEQALMQAVVVADVPVMVVSPEFLAIMKMAAQRPKDLEDLRFLLTQSVEFDHDKARGVARRFLGVYAAHELDTYRDEFRWMNEREEAAKTGPKKR